MCEDYGVWQEKSNYGKTYMGIVRTTYIIDEVGKITHVFPKVKVKGHAAAVLEAATA
jgi:peroxiredoxin Q/BCP